MTNKEFYREFGSIDPKMIEAAAPAEKVQKKKKNAWIKWASMAACLALIISAIIVVPMFQKDKLPDVPTWDTAQYSAEEIANLFGSMKLEGVATNAYTKIYVPNSKYLYIGNVMNDEYLDLYQHTEIDKELSEAELQTFIDAFLPKMAESLDVPVPQYNIKENNYSTGNSLSARADIGPYYMSISQNEERNSFGLSKLGGNRQIVIEGETIKIDQRLSDEEILESIQSIKNKLFSIFNVSFSDAKIIRSFGSYSEYGAEHIDIYFYDESAHYLNSLRNRPISDYIYISFDNFANYSGDIVSDGILKVSSINYFKNRINVSETYTLVASAKKISISEAEALLYNGYVFGGHSCPLCMKAQDKVSFEGYDFVDNEYVFGYDNKTGKSTLGIPFYVFYKNIGTSENGNTIYAKTYVAAIEVSGYDEYFKSQKDSHRNNWQVDKIS